MFTACDGKQTLNVILKCNNQSAAIKAVVISFESHWVMKKYVYGARLMVNHSLAMSPI
jgi:hypothetical protein